MAGQSVRGGRGFVVAGIGVALLACALRAPVATLPFERDEGEYAYIAQRWFEGDVPYRDAFDQKPPAIFAFYAAAFALFGENEAAVRWTAQLASLVGLAAIAWTGARLATPGAGLAAAIVGAAFGSHPCWLANAVNTELLAVTPLALGALAALAAGTPNGVRMSLAAGALGGLALLLKPVTAPIVAFQLGTALWLGRRRVLAHAAAVACGVAAPLVATALWFAAHGALRELLDAVVLHNLEYAANVGWSDYPGNFARRVAPSVPALAPIYAAVVAAPLALLPVSAASIAPRWLAWLGGWLVVSLLAISAGGYFRHHYFLLALPPVALLAGVALDALGRLAFRARPDAARWAGSALALALLGWAVAACWWYFGPAPAAAKMQRLYDLNPFVEAPGLGQWLAEHSAPTDRILVYGSEPELLFHARRRSATPYIFLYPLTMPLPSAGERQRALLAAIDASPPEMVVAAFAYGSMLSTPETPRDLHDGLRERLERSYDLVAVVPYLEDRSTLVLEYGDARAAWRERPPWDEPMPWAAFAAWKRRADALVPLESAD